MRFLRHCDSALGEGRLRRVVEIDHNSFSAQPAEPPIPEDVRAGRGWTEQMLEMADHIGAYRTLLLVERFGGMRIYIPADPAKGKTYEGRGSIRDVVGDEAAGILSRIYRREYLSIPTARHALSRARRQGLIASARAKEITVAEAARELGTTRSYMSHLVNHTDEGEDVGSPTRRGRPAGQKDLFENE
jgi:hypothetical protein